MARKAWDLPVGDARVGVARVDHHAQPALEEQLVQRRLVVLRAVVWLGPVVVSWKVPKGTAQQ